MKIKLTLIASVVMMGSFFVLAKQVEMHDCNLSKRCCKVVSKYEALKPCEKIVFIKNAFSRKYFYKRKVYLGLQNYILDDMYVLTNHLGASAGFIGLYYESREQLDGDIKEWKRILGCNQDE